MEERMGVNEDFWIELKTQDDHDRVIRVNCCLTLNDLETMGQLLSDFEQGSSARDCFVRLLVALVDDETQLTLEQATLISDENLTPVCEKIMKVNGFHEAYLKIKDESDIYERMFKAYRTYAQSQNEIWTSTINSLREPVQYIAELTKRLQPDIGIAQALSQTLNTSKYLFSAVRDLSKISYTVSEVYKKTYLAQTFNVKLYENILTPNLKSVLHDFRLSYSNLFVSQSLLSLPSRKEQLYDLSANEYFNNEGLLGAVVEPEVADNVQTTLDEGLLAERRRVQNQIQTSTHEALATMLRDLDPGYVEMWNGSIQAFKSDNPDRYRHAVVSLRELFTQVLHRLAPDEAVKKWATPDMYHQGKLTRKARLLYICRHIKDDKLAKFVQKDIDAVLELADFLNGRTHEIAPRMDEITFKALVLRLEGTIRYLLELSQF
jgi:hypothetical protein